MQVVDPSVVVINTVDNSAYSMIERVGRICYKSENMITNDSAVKFVTAMYKNGHHAMLEHYHVMLGFDIVSMNTLLAIITRYSGNHSVNLFKFINITNLVRGGRTFCFASASLRAWMELISTLKGDPFANHLGYILFCEYPELFPEFTNPTYKCAVSIWEWDEFELHVNSTDFLEPHERKDIMMHHKPLTVIFTCDMLIHRELVRHRVASFAGESTRYCNYSKAKFGNEITVVRPLSFDAVNTPEVYAEWYKACADAERSYFSLLSSGVTPQDARAVLPVSTKSELAMTCTESEWKHVIDLRYRGTTGKPHPQVEYLMGLAYTELLKFSNNRLKETDT